MHIMSDERYNRLMAMQAYLEDPATPADAGRAGHRQAPHL